MANTSAVYARIDTGLKENAENILAQLWYYSVKCNSDALQSDCTYKKSTLKSSTSCG